MTIEEFEQLADDGYRSELVRGRLVREPPAGFDHGRIGIRLAMKLAAFVEEARLGVVVGAETGFILSEVPPTVRAPDIAFVACARIPASGPPRGFFPGAPDLAVEIVSPSNSPAEIRDKVHDYLDAGARAVWVVEPRARTVTVHHPEREALLLREGDRLDGGEVLPGFGVQVGEIFGG
jgi:Uma2 family endonuclease